MVEFEINPLDINLAKIQFGLINDFSAEVINLPIEKSFENHDYMLKFENLTVRCFFDENKKINLEVEVGGKDKKYFYTLKKGKKAEIYEYLQTQTFLFAIKELVQEISKNS